MEKIRLKNVTLAFDRRGSGSPLLLIHGFPLDRSVWTQLSTRLESNFDVIMPDLPGFGDSSIPQGDTTIDQMAADLAELLDGLNIPATYLAGHSMGGYVALAFAHAYPHRVLGLGLLGSQATPDSPESKAGRFATAEQVGLKGANAVAGMAEKLSANPSLAPYFREIILRQRPAGIIAALKAMAGRADATKFVGEFNFPVILVHGQADVLIPPERARELKALVPQAILLELPGVGHSSMLEAPDETAQALLKFLNL
jgi:pimeloyl-ACP methyl ester carboxylesterase